MTPICSEHKSLLLSVSKNLSDWMAQLAYSDWLQERNSPGYLIVARYPPVNWPVWVGDLPRTKWLPSYGHNGESWELPWLEGVFCSQKRISQPKARIKTILKAYANGEVLL